MRSQPSQCHWPLSLSAGGGVPDEGGVGASPVPDEGGVGAV